MAVKLRNYQRAVAARVKGAGNHVVVLPTGAGKTHVSFDLIFESLSKNWRKLVCFLAPTVALVQQQRHEFQEETHKRGLDLFAGLLAGGKRHDVGRCHIVFATPEAAFNELIKCDKMKDLSLIVLDEVHHVEARSGKSRHPYSKIADMYGDAPNKRARPKLLGLTASPSDNSEETRRMLHRLEASLVIVREPELVTELDTIVPKAELMADRLSCSNAFNTFCRECVRVQQALQRKLSDNYVVNFAFEEHQARLRAVAELAARVRCLGWGNCGWFDGLRLLSVDHDLENPWESLLASSATDCSPCFLRLLSILQQKRPERCIVFVETRQAARDMAKVLRNVAASPEWDLGWLSPTHLVGHCKRGDDETMSMTDQQAILSDFRRGETNVMVATSVAEEGIDITACNLVVRMEPVHTVIKFVQARGRARCRNSSCLIMCADVSEETMVRSVAQRERQLDAELADLCESHEAENCWDTTNAPELLDPYLMAQFPPQNASREVVLGDEQVIRGEILVPLIQLVPTQSSVEKKFSDGRSVLKVMAQLVRNPVDIRALPLMRVSRENRAMLGRRSEAFRNMHPGREVWFSADNRRCFMFMVIAPLIPGMVSVKALHVNWTHEFDCKLNQCPRLGDTWTTDDAGVEAARDALLRELIEPLSEALPQPKKRLRGGGRVELFMDGEDYVSRLNLHLQHLQRPHSGAAPVEYRQTGPDFTMEVCVSGTTEWHRGERQNQKKAAKQAAAFKALQVLDAL